MGNILTVMLTSPLFHRTMSRTDVGWIKRDYLVYTKISSTQRRSRKWWSHGREVFEQTGGRAKHGIYLNKLRVTSSTASHRTAAGVRPFPEPIIQLLTHSQKPSSSCTCRDDVRRRQILVKSKRRLESPYPNGPKFSIDKAA
jgi:hypothetical protein